MMDRWEFFCEIHPRTRWRYILSLTLVNHWVSQWASQWVSKLVSQWVRESLTYRDATHLKNDHMSYRQTLISLLPGPLTIRPEKIVAYNIWNTYTTSESCQQQATHLPKLSALVIITLGKILIILPKELKGKWTNPITILHSEYIKMWRVYT